MIQFQTNICMAHSASSRSSTRSGSGRCIHSPSNTHVGVFLLTPYSMLSWPQWLSTSLRLSHQNCKCYISTRLHASSSQVDILCVHWNLVKCVLCSVFGRCNTPWILTMKETCSSISCPLSLVSLPFPRYSFLF